MDKRRRREIIKELISVNPPATQQDLVRELIARGMDVDQSTVSRDLREMGVVRLPEPKGGMVYGFPGESNLPPAGEELQHGVRDYVKSIEVSGNLLVIRTAPGNAQPLAAILDRSRREEIAGTVAGDDTIILVMREGHSAKKLNGEFMEMAR
jgi:transcriptional regulator of arginine metabolism